MSDLIRRSDAIEALHGEVQITGKENAMAVQHLIGRFTFNIANIPSADAIEPKRGEWVDEADKYDASFGIHDYRCSNCNSYADEYIGGHDWYTAGKPNFCPNCGARMKGADDERHDI